MSRAMCPPCSRGLRECDCYDQLDSYPTPPEPRGGELARQIEILRRAAEVPVPDDDTDFTPEKARRGAESWRTLARNTVAAFDAMLAAAPSPAAPEGVEAAAQVLAERVLAYVAPPPKNRANPMLDADMELQALAWTVLDGLGYPPAIEGRVDGPARLRSIVAAMTFPRNRLPTDAVLEVYADSPKDKAHHFAEDILSALCAAPLVPLADGGR